MSRLRRPTLLTIATNVYDRLMASNSWRGLEALLAWCDDVNYVTQRGRDPILVLTFNKSEDFFRWRDWIVDTPMPYCYTLSVSVVHFFRSVVSGDKWHASNLKG